MSNAKCVCWCLSIIENRLFQRDFIDYYKHRLSWITRLTQSERRFLVHQCKVRDKTEWKSQWMYRGLAIKLIAASDKDHVWYLKCVMLGTIPLSAHSSTVLYRCTGLALYSTATFHCKSQRPKVLLMMSCN